MKNYLFHVALASMVCVLGSCNSDEKEASVAESPTYITISSHILSRVATAENGSQTFEDGDKVSVYAWTGSKEAVPEAGLRVVNGVTNTLQNGTWQASPQMLWKNMDDEHFFIGIYPSNDQPIADLEADVFEVNPDEQEASDLLVATNLEGTKAQANPVSLSFDHLMAKVIVNLTFRSQWGADGPEVASVTLTDMAAKCKVDYLKKLVSAEAERGTFTLHEETPNSCYASVVVPQTGVSEIKVNINGKDYVYNHGGDIGLESGKRTVINLIVGRDELGLGGITISDWQDGDEINGGEALD